MPTPDQLYDEATDLRDKGDRDGALAQLQEALELDPNHTLSHGMLAKICADLARADEAVFHAQKVVELEPNDVFSYTALSVICQRVGRIAEAEEAKAKAYYKQMGYE